MLSGRLQGFIPKNGHRFRTTFFLCIQAVETEGACTAQAMQLLVLITGAAWAQRPMEESGVARSACGGVVAGDGIARAAGVARGRGM
jgi:hypothetical protein